tara:strand:+ start:101 stop:511 length:411 start_codon:yes stop_codon:yes gene_type:complete
MRLGELVQRGVTKVLLPGVAAVVVASALIYSPLTPASSPYVAVERDVSGDGIRDRVTRRLDGDGVGRSRYRFEVEFGLSSDAQGNTTAFGPPQKAFSVDIGDVREWSVEGRDIVYVTSTGRQKIAYRWNGSEFTSS